MAKVGRRAKTKPGEWATGEGIVVTADVEERWSEECEEDFDLHNWTPARVGVPPPGGERVSRLISIRVSPDLFDAARAKAAGERRSIGNLVREALRSHVEI